MPGIYKSFPEDSRRVNEDEYKFKERTFGLSYKGHTDEAKAYLDTMFYPGDSNVCLITANAFTYAVSVLWPLLTFLTFWIARRHLKRHYEHEIKVLKQL